MCNDQGGPAAEGNRKERTREVSGTEARAASVNQANRGSLITREVDGEAGRSKSKHGRGQGREREPRKGGRENEL
jgi:hypothetical protein